VKQDFAEAVRWYRQAADKGHPGAQFTLGNLYELGQGVATNMTQAAEWYRKAAEQKNAEAEYAVGLCYADGDGLPADPVEAYKWISLAAAHGHQLAAGFKPTLEKRLTTEQKAKGKQMVEAALGGRATPPN
jgi:uncharacterized protein